MAQDRSVSVTLKMKADEYISTANRAKKATEDFGAATQSSKKAAQDHSDALKKVATGMAVGGAAIALGIGKAVSAFADFDSAMSAAQAATGASGAALTGLRDLAIKMGADTQYSATEAANAITEMGKAGVSTADIMGGGLKGALDLAAAGQLDVGRAGEIAATAMNQFGLAGKDIPHVADLMAAAAGKAQGSVEDVANAMKYVGPVAKSMGLSIEETTGVIAEFASKGILGEQAGTSLRGVLLSLTAPSDAAAQTMKNFGISIYDAQGHTKSYAEIAQNLHDQLSGVDEATRNAALGQIFGNAQITAATILYEGGASAVNKWTKEVNDSGFASRQAAQLTDNLKGDLERLSGSIDTAFIKSGSSANGVLRSIAQNAEGAVNVIGNLPGPVLLGSAAFAAFALVGPKVVQQYKDVRKTLDDAGLSIDKIGAKSPRAAVGIQRMATVAKVAGAAFAGLAIASKTLDGAMDQVGVQQLTNDLSGSSDALNTINKAFAAATDTGTGFDSNVKSLGDALRYTFNSGVGDQIDSTAGSIFAAFGGNNTSDIKVATDRIGQLDAALAGLVSSGSGTQAAQVMAQIEQAASDQGISLDALKKQFPQYAEALAGASAAAAQMGTAVAGANGPSDAFAGSLQDQQQAAQDAADALDRARKAFVDYGDTVSGALNANVAYRQAVADANAALVDQKGNLDKSKLGFDTNTQAGRDNTLALTGLAQKAKENALAAFDQTQKTATLSNSLKASRAEFVALAVKMGASTADANRLADQLGVTSNNSDLLNQALGRQPKSTHTDVQADSRPAIAAVGAAQQKLDQIDGRVATATIAVNTAAAFANVRALAGYIDGIRSKTVTIDTYVGTYAGKPVPKAEGGYIEGPGTATSDSIPARLSNGEYVIKAAAVAEYGKAFFDNLNARRYADGGFVSRVHSTASPVVSAPSGPSVTISNLTTTDTPRAIASAVTVELGKATALIGPTGGLG